MGDQYGFGRATIPEPPINPNMSRPTGYDSRDPAAQGPMGATAAPGADTGRPLNPNVQPIIRPENPNLGATVGGGVGQFAAGVLASAFDGAAWDTKPTIATEAARPASLGGSGSLGGALADGGTWKATTVDQSTTSEKLTPEVVAGRAKAEFMARGGSQKTWNDASVAAGVRPAIDGRATADPKGSNASEEIRAKWGWNADPKNFAY